MLSGRQDRTALLEAHRLALLKAKACEEVLIFSHPRLSEFPPIREHAVSLTTDELQPIMERDLTIGKVHHGKVISLTTISAPSVHAHTVIVIAEDDDNSAMRLVLHYFTAEHLLERVAQLLPEGSRLCIKEPYFQTFPDKGAAVCCAQPVNVVMQPPAGAPAQPQALLEEGRFLEALELLEQRLRDEGSCDALEAQWAEAAVGAGRYRDAAQFYLRQNNPESKQKARQCFQHIKESEKGEYDFADLHRRNLEGSRRFPCASFWNKRVTVRESCGRGLGVHALESLSAGELVVGSKADHLILNRDISGRKIWRAPGWDEEGEDCSADTLLMQQLARKVLCNSDRRDALLALARGSAEASTDADEAALLRLLQVVKTNRFTALEPWEGSSIGTGLWTLPARINHACDANCSWYNIGDMMFVNCQCDIASGEELTICYCNPTDSCEERRDSMGRHGFVCSCGLCQARQRGDAEAQDYDQQVARAQLAEDTPEIRHHKQSLRASLKCRTAAFEFLDAPAYCSQRHAQAEHALAAYDACDRLKQPEAATKWLDKARRIFALQWGSNPAVFNLFARDRGVAIPKVPKTGC